MTTTTQPSSSTCKLDTEFSDLDFEANLLVPECVIQDRYAAVKQLGGADDRTLVDPLPAETITLKNSSKCSEEASCDDVDDTSAGGRTINNYKGPVTFKCHKCDFSANKMSQLKQHEQSVHDGFRYACDRCHFKTTTKVNLKAGTVFEIFTLGFFFFTKLLRSLIHTLDDLRNLTI